MKSNKTVAEIRRKLRKVFEKAEGDPVGLKSDAPLDMQSREVVASLRRFLLKTNTSKKMKRSA